ncbi:MAG: ParB N-terminal domain-containing protein [Treponema sp.]|jgi:ParB family chromosome partitioning protein|nr:ParB N-terminal domain-containing protein [Treponema sp.]
MQVPIEDIIVKKRIRQDMGNIEALAESLKKFGQISPVVISKKNILIAGGRRLEAAKSLGWRTINAVVADIPAGLSPLEYEVEENLQRQDFNSEEAAEASRRIYHLRNPGFLIRFFRWIAGLFKRLFGIDAS